MPLLDRADNRATSTHPLTSRLSPLSAQLGFHLPHVSVTTASHVRSSGDTHKGPIEELGCHLIRAHCLAPQSQGRMGTPDLRHLSCPEAVKGPSVPRSRETGPLAWRSPLLNRPFHFSPPLSQLLELRGSHALSLYLPQHIAALVSLLPLSPHRLGWAWGGSGQQQGQDPPGVLSSSWGALSPEKTSHFPLSLPTTTSQWQG